MELLNTDVLFDVDLQGQGSMEQFICDRIQEMFITNEDGMQNIKGLSVTAATATKDWSLHITPSDKGGHYNIVNLIDSVIIPAMEKYSILVKTKLDIQNREVQIIVGRAAAGIITIESDLPNIIKKSVTIKQVTAMGKTMWHYATVGHILKNRLYCGELEYRKEYVPDYLEQKRAKNKGELERVIVEGKH